MARLLTKVTPKIFVELGCRRRSGWVRRQHATERDLTMSTDKNVTTNLIEVLEDGAKGFASAADRLKETDRPDLAVKFAEFSTQRAQFSAELEKMAAAYGDDIEEDGSIKATVHRAWMAVKDTLSGSDPEGVLDAAEQGEDYAVDAYEEALKQEISIDLRTTVQRQFADVKATHDQVRALRNAHS